MSMFYRGTHNSYTTHSHQTMWLDIEKHKIPHPGYRELHRTSIVWRMNCNLHMGTNKPHKSHHFHNSPTHINPHTGLHSKLYSYLHTIGRYHRFYRWHIVLHKVSTLYWYMSLNHFLPRTDSTHPSNSSHMYQVTLQIYSLLGTPDKM